MKRSKFISFLLFAALLIIISKSPAAQEYNLNKNYVSNQIILKLKDNVSIEELAKANQQNQVKIKKYCPAGDFYVLEIPSDLSVSEAISYYSKTSLVDYAEPDYLYYAEENGRVSVPKWTPNDPLYPEQWNFSQINMPAAWEIDDTEPFYGGDPEVVIAILDTGVAYEDYTNDSGVEYAQAPDLAGTLFVPGFDYVNNDEHPNDDNGHGTHVAGIIAQTTNNNYGAAGIAFNCALMPVKVLTSYGMGSASAIAEGIYYALEHGANVISMSFGGAAAGATLSLAVAEAYANNMVLVCSGGSSGRCNETYPNYPSDFKACLCVGAIGTDGFRMSFSDYGPKLDLVAPGQDITQENFCDIWTNFTAFCFPQITGVSFANAHVAGAAALILSEAKAQGLTLSADQVRDTLNFTAFRYDDKNTIFGPPGGYDYELGHGILDVYSALTVQPQPILEYLDYRIEKSKAKVKETENLYCAVRSLWCAASGVELTLQSTDPYLRIINGSASLGDLPYRTEVENLAQPFIIEVLEDCPNDYPASVNLQITCSNGLAKDFSFTVLLNPSQILIVDDDNGGSFETYYMESLEANNYTYAIYERSASSGCDPNKPALPAIGDLLAYKAVIWFNGGSSGPALLSPDEQNLIAAYLDKGGRLLLSSQEYFYDSYGYPGGSDVVDLPTGSFDREYLKLAQVEEDEYYYTATGAEGDPIGDGLNLQLIDVLGNWWPDDFIPTDEAAAVLYSGANGGDGGGDDAIPQGPCALRYPADGKGSFRIIFCSFALEAIDNTQPFPNNRDAVLGRMLSWLIGQEPEQIGYYVLDCYGKIYPFNGAPALENHPLWTEDMARDLVIYGDNYYILDKLGKVYQFPLPGLELADFTPLQNTTAWDLEPNCWGDGFFGLTGDGVIRSFQGALPLNDTPTWLGKDYARDLELNCPGPGYYIIIGSGEVFSGFGAPELNLHPLWDGDVARDLEVLPYSAASGAVGYYILETYGRIYNFGSAPPLEYITFDDAIARDLEFVEN